MNFSKRCISLLRCVLFFLFPFLGFTSAEKNHLLLLFDQFEPSWSENWKEKKPLPFVPGNEFNVISDASGNSVLKVTSSDSNSALLRPLDYPVPSKAILSWRWRVAKPLSNPDSERQKSGDDYAARVFAIFETALLPTRTKAINYVCSHSEESHQFYPGPYSETVAMLALRNGPEGFGWNFEERDIIADYLEYFGEVPTKLSAVAVGVDTDNTDSEATAMFADLKLELIYEK